MNEISQLTYHQSDKQHLPELVHWLSDTIRSIGMNGAAVNKDPLSRSQCLECTPYSHAYTT